MVGKIINKVMETVPQLVGQITDVFNSLLKKAKGSTKEEAPRRPAVRPRPASSSTGSTSSNASSSSAASKPAASSKKAAAPKKKAPAAPKGSARASASAANPPAEKNISVSNAALAEMTYKELYAVSQDLDITGRKGMRKAELLKAIQKENKG